MDQLADVKTKVKTWERAFRRDNGRAPTKDDIRKGGEISEQYTLWRKLSKEAEKKAKGKGNSKENGKCKDGVKEARRDDHSTPPTLKRGRTSRLPSPPPAPRLSEAGPSRPHPLMSTPKRRKLDDNPFSVSREAPSPSVLVKGTPKRQRLDFVHVNSPKQLKALLESASKSPRKDTPRTHARRWLAGEVDSPVRRKREFRGRQEAEEEEELGETPIKGEAFAILDEEPKGRDLFPIFRRAAGRTSGAGKIAENGRKGTGMGLANGKRKVVEPEMSRTKARGPSSDDEGMDEDELESTIPPTTPPPPSRSRPTGERVLELTDDEFDPEASPAVVTIIGTRRTAIRVNAMFDDDNMIIDEHESSEEDEEDAEAEVTDEGVELVTEGSRSMLSLLSLRSPIGRAGERMADLRVRALLDPTSAAAIALRAQRRGQDVFACGETGFEEEYLEIGVEVEVGDDDWESDAEGWKAEGEVGEEDW
ncbi:hypothetical protein CspeluHIS016_0700800 [Cutaneotrichosporon spelunceum]|uniref:DNA replication regulator SLD2 n=1 Tax=Cutaneotrichosporon spelunceum TaxID=1672016 RepID=A0AAD3TZ07_9TREE|nr:hypothetical protein CspeluHIS016_0700800 [Cutaneotrichosporon spelunceum]